ncbi:hypothetical protein ACXM2N_03380 [Corynebacterium sp. ZY180755]
MIRITVQTTTPAGETIERTREFTDYDAADRYRAACIRNGRPILKEEKEIS